MTKKILLCAYAFPPIAGAQSLRWFYLAKYLASIGWNIDVLSITPSEGYPKYDASLLKELPSNIRIIRTYPGFIHSIAYRKKRKIDVHKSKNSFRRKSKNSIKTKLLRSIYRGVSYLLIPDRMIEWLPFALLKGRKLVKENRYDVLISSGFPFSSHIIAFFLKKWGKTPWVLDNGDPWAFHPSNYPKLIKFLNKNLESIILRLADKLVVTTEETKGGYLKFYPFLDESKIDVIPCGFDDELYIKIGPKMSNRFRLIFTGNLSYSVRGSFSFFDASDYIRDIDKEIIIAGHVSTDVVNYVMKKDIKDVKFLGFISQEEVVALQKSASVLFLFGWPEGYQVPSKLFEYIAARRPILYISYGENDIGAKIVKRYKKGIVTSINPEDISKSIKELYELWREDKYEKEFDLSTSEDFSWKKRADEFELVINELKDSKK